ncbi:MAG TPA: pyocin knob domain-containing protein [Candidatus Omnitrophota bacterium]|nr:pyocin knob domain-containing protein [Candidatus Omnitrophota bacterium]
MALPYSDPANPANPSPLFSDITAARGDHMRANNNAIFLDLTYLDNLIAANWARTIFGDNAYGSTLVTNLGAITKSGFYTCLGTATDVPDTNFSWFVIHQNSALGVASMYQRAVAFSTSIIVYERTKISSTWGAWRETGAEATGSEKMFFGDVAPRGWVIEDGKTLATSGGDYNGTVYYALYAHIWNLVNRAVVPSTYLSAAKGASADADWTAGKKIYLPDRRATSPKGTGSQSINTRTKVGPALGVPEEDQAQDHGHRFKRGLVKYDVGSTSSMLTDGGTSATGYIYDIIETGGGVPRAGLTTRDNTLGTNFIIKL